MILFDAPRRLGLRPTSFHSNVDFIEIKVDFIEIKVDFIEIKVDFIEKKVGKMKRKFQTWPYYASVHVYVTGSQNPKPHCSWVSFSPRWQISEFSRAGGGGAIAPLPPCSYATGCTPGFRNTPGYHVICHLLVIMS